MLSARLMEKLKMEQVAEKRLAFADGQSQILPAGPVRIGTNGERQPCPAIFGTRDEYLPGAPTPGIFDLAVEPIDETLARSL